MTLLEEFALITREQIARENYAQAQKEMARADKFERWAEAITSENTTALETKRCYLNLAKDCIASALALLSLPNQ